MGYLVAPVATFGENLTRLREAAGLKTSKSLADRLDVVPSVISKMENDLQGLPETPTMLRLAKALGCTIDDLLDGVDADYDALRRQRISLTTMAEDLGVDFREFFTLWRGADEETKTALLTLLRSAARAPAAPPVPAPADAPAVPGLPAKNVGEAR